MHKRHIVGFCSIVWCESVKSVQSVHNVRFIVDNRADFLGRPEMNIVSRWNIITFYGLIYKKS